MIDFHSHILPEMDDGSASLEESIAMLRMEAEQGITHVVATPHFYARYDKPEEYLQRRKRAEERLRNELAKHSDLPQISVGAEVYYFHGMSNSDFLPNLTVAGTSCIMVEMPGSPWQPSVYQELEMIYQRWGFVPIVAHVDRYIAPLRTHGIPEQLARLPVMVQANADFFLNRSTAGMAMRMLKKDLIQLLGSDCHNLSSRKPDLGDALHAIEGKLGQAALERVHEYGREILGLS